MTRNARLHLIYIPDRAERLRAIDLFLDVPATRIRLPGNRMVVTKEHITALEQAKVAFELISANNPNGRQATTDQTAGRRRWLDYI